MSGRVDKGLVGGQKGYHQVYGVDITGGQDPVFGQVDMTVVRVDHVVSTTEVSSDQDPVVGHVDKVETE